MYESHWAAKRTCFMFMCEFVFPSNFSSMSYDECRVCVYCLCIDIDRHNTHWPRALNSKWISELSPNSIPSVSSLSLSLPLFLCKHFNINSELQLRAMLARSAREHFIEYGCKLNKRVIFRTCKIRIHIAITIRIAISCLSASDCIRRVHED